jgi:hypothetical protein
MNTTTSKQIAMITIQEPAREKLMEFSLLKEKIISLSTRFLSQIPLFLKNVDSLEEIFKKKKSHIRLKSQELSIIQRKLLLGLEVFLGETAKSSQQIKNFENSVWAGTLKKITASLERFALELREKQVGHLGQNDEDFKKSLRMINFFLETVYCRKVRGDLLVMDVQKLFKTFLKMLESQKGKKNFWIVCHVLYHDFLK